MQHYKNNFKGKKITIMGLGLLGRGLGVAKFLAECGADLVVTDLKSKEQLSKSVKELSKFKLIKFVLGEHRMEDFKNRDMIIKNPGVPMDSVYIKEAKKNKIPVKMDASLFAEYAPGVTIVGITGTRGKSMTTMLIYEILKENKKFLKGEIHLSGNLRGLSTLPLLKKVKEGDTVVLELDSWQLQGFGEDKISPHISVFTTFMPDHMNYYTSTGLSISKAMKLYFNDKANIFKYQNKNDFLVVLRDVKKLLPKNIESKTIVANDSTVKDWDFVVPGDFQKDNLACAVEVAKIFNIPIKNIQKSVKNFKGVEGRLQYLKTIKGVKIYNDNNATTPQATVAGLNALVSSPKQGLGLEKVVLIIGGNDKGMDVKILIETITKNCKCVVLLPGTGTEKLLAGMEGISVLDGKVYLEDTLKKAVNQAVALSKKGDTILFSPAFSSFSQWNNEYERNDEFIKIIKGLK